MTPADSISQLTAPHHALGDFPHVPLEDFHALMEQIKTHGVEDTLALAQLAQMADRGVEPKVVFDAVLLMGRDAYRDLGAGWSFWDVVTARAFSDPSSALFEQWCGWTSALPAELRSFILLSVVRACAHLDDSELLTKLLQPGERLARVVYTLAREANVTGPGMAWELWFDKRQQCHETQAPALDAMFNVMMRGRGDVLARKIYPHSCEEQAYRTAFESTFDLSGIGPGLEACGLLKQFWRQGRAVFPLVMQATQPLNWAILAHQHNKDGTFFEHWPTVVDMWVQEYGRRDWMERGQDMAHMTHLAVGAGLSLSHYHEGNVHPLRDFSMPEHFITEMRGAANDSWANMGKAWVAANMGNDDQKWLEMAVMLDQINCLDLMIAGQWGATNKIDEDGVGAQRWLNFLNARPTSCVRSVLAGLRSTVDWTLNVPPAPVQKILAQHTWTPGAHEDALLRSLHGMIEHNRGNVFADILHNQPWHSFFHTPEQCKRTASILAKHWCSLMAAGDFEPIKDFWTAMDGSDTGARLKETFVPRLMAHLFRYSKPWHTSMGYNTTLNHNALFDLIDPRPQSKEAVLQLVEIVGDDLIHCFQQARTDIHSIAVMSDSSKNDWEAFVANINAIYLEAQLDAPGAKRSMRKI